MTDLEFIIENGLEHVFAYVSNNNTSNNAPYHNLKHMVSVAKKCNFLINTEDAESNKHEVLVAALFHDFNHSMGKENDEYNVASALKGFVKFIDDNPDYDINTDIVIECIRATQYPYIIPSDELTIEQQIIRDSDLLISCDSDFFYYGIYGLMEEMGVTDINIMLDGQKKFHESVELSTHYARTLYEVDWKVFDNLKMLNKIYK